MTMMPPCYALTSMHALGVDIYFWHSLGFGGAWHVDLHPTHLNSHEMLATLETIKYRVGIHGEQGVLGSGASGHKGVCPMEDPVGHPVTQIRQCSWWQITSGVAVAAEETLKATGSKRKRHHAEREETESDNNNNEWANTKSWPRELYIKRDCLAVDNTNVFLTMCNTYTSMRVSPQLAAKHLTNGWIQRES